MPNLLGFDVWVEMDGVKLPEYKPETKNDEREISCWIPCEAGKDFRIGCTLPRERIRSQHHQLDFYLDGRRAYLRSSVVKKEPHARTDIVRRFDEERFDDGGSFKTFQIQFGNLELTDSVIELHLDDDAYLRNSGSASELGEIRVVVHSVGELLDNDAKKPGTGVYPGSGSRRVHERSRKCLKHCVRLGKEKERYIPAGATRTVNKKQICTFVFKYRHLDMLMADGIVPPKAPKKRVIISSSGLQSNQLARASRKRRLHEVEEDQESDGDIEKAEKEVEIRKLKAQLAALEQQLGNSRPTKRIKMESTSTLISGEVIDLTI